MVTDEPLEPVFFDGGPGAEQPDPFAVNAPVNPWRSRAELEDHLQTALLDIQGFHSHFVPTDDGGYKFRRDPPHSPRPLPQLLFQLPMFRRALHTHRDPQQALETLLEGGIRTKVSWSHYALIWFGLTAEAAALTPWTRALQATKSSGLTERADRDRIVREEILRDLASFLATDAPEKGPVRLPSFDEVVGALDHIVKKGLPLDPMRYSDSALLELLPDEASVNPNFANHELASVARLEMYLRNQLNEFEVEELARSARILFACAPGTKGTLLKVRESKIVQVLGRGDQHVRKGIRMKIVAALAWQMLRAKLTEPVNNPESGAE